MAGQSPVRPCGHHICGEPDSDQSSPLFVALIPSLGDLAYPQVAVANLAHHQ